MKTIKLKTVVNRINFLIQAVKDLTKEEAITISYQNNKISLNAHTKDPSYFIVMMAASYANFAQKSDMPYSEALEYFKRSYCIYTSNLEKAEQEIKP